MKNMDFLQVKGKEIVDEGGRPVKLRGFCIGGWMNMEDFINGYPGSEEGIRAAMADSIGKERAEFFFDRMLDHLFNEGDVRFIKECGANAVRLALNYRHFEDDSKPFVYKASGFARLDKALDWCEKHEVYAILDLHSVQGWQNTDWHCDNSSRHTFFWNQLQFQDRFIALWEELAGRYKGRSAVAGYDLMNEPITNACRGRFSNIYIPDWDVFNRVYRRTVKAIRKIDPKHIIYLEGDNFSALFEGLDEPFDDNLVYSSHNYIDSGLTGAYPGTIRTLWEIKGRDEEVWWDRRKQEEVFYSQEGTKFAQKYNVPLWVSEFGSVYNVPDSEIPDRLRSLDDQLGIFGEFGAHWTIWTYKDPGVMGTLMLDPESDYLQLIKPILEKKELLNSHFGVSWVPANTAKKMAAELADYIEAVIGEPYVNTTANRRYLGQAVFSSYAALLLQPAYAGRFKGMTEQRLDSILESFELKNCRRNEGLISVLKKYTPQADKTGLSK
jgi:endoglucanase